ncbi:MAG: CpaF family protein [Nitrospirota bacterium]
MEFYTQILRSFLGPLVPYLDDPKVTEILVNSPTEVFVERSGKLENTGAAFQNMEAVMSAVQSIAQFVGKRVNEENPYIDARLPDGSRVAIVISPCSRKGVTISIRKFSKDAMNLNRLVEFEAISEEMVRFIQVCVLLKKNIVVSGGTGSGKTSLLNVVSSLIAKGDRIVTLEDSAELQLQQDHVVPLESKPPDKHGKGAVPIRDLLRATLRLRPDRIIVGELRAGEALDLIQAMNTGHGGSMTTIHANSPKHCLSRLETLALMSEVELPILPLRAQIAGVVEVLLHTGRLPDGSRKVTHISEVLGLDESGNYIIKDLFVYKRMGRDASGKVLGQHVATGTVPSFYEEIEHHGLSFPKEIFLAGAQAGVGEAVGH